MGDAAEDAERRAEREVEEPTIDVEAEEELEPEVRSAELAIREEREAAPAPASILPSPREWEASMAVAEKIAGTQFVPESYRGKPDAVLAAILTGREMGIGPMQALRQIHMIDGRPAFSADLMMAKMRAGGVVVLESSVSDEGAYIKAKRKDTGEEAEAEWTKADAEQAGLLGKKNWKTYPADMYWARCVGRLARRLGSDLLGGLVYAKEEMEDWDDGGYGGSYGYEAPPKVFDPEHGLAPGAPTSREEIAAQFNRFDPSVDWAETTALVVQAVYGKDSSRVLEGDDLLDFYRRLANSVWHIEQHIGAGDFPPATAEQIADGFAYGFSGIVVEIVYREVPTPEPVEKMPIDAETAKEIDKKLEEEDVPFGDEK